jgi:ribosome biogenesis protein SSF1/2
LAESESADTGTQARAYVESRVKFLEAHIGADAGAGAAKKNVSKTSYKQSSGNYNEEDDFNLGVVPKLQNSFVPAGGHAKRKNTEDEEDDGKKKKKRTHVQEYDDTKKKSKSLVFKRGDVGQSVSTLVKEFRKVMEPNTAINLKEKKNNAIKDFVSVSGSLGVTHFFIFSSTNVGSYLKIGTVPHGPTITFRILDFSLCKDVRNIQSNPYSPSLEFKTDPILILSGFNQGEDDQKYFLTKTCLKEAFPSVNVNTIKIDECKRAVLFHFDKETERIQFRHYVITSSTTGVSEPIKSIFKGKDLDKGELGKYNDISEYILQENENNQTNMQDEESTFQVEGKNTTYKKAVKLVEIGPRMDLLLIKVEEKLCSGIVWYHRYIHKTPEEIEEQRKKVEQKRKLKELRKKEQELNVQKKKRFERRK